MGADDKQGSWWQTVPGVLTAVGTVIAALTGLIVALKQVPSQPTAPPAVLATPLVPIKNATIPSVIGLSLAEAALVLKSLGFTSIHPVRKFSAAVPGTVIEQVPNAGTELPLDKPVKLFVAANEGEGQAKTPISNEQTKGPRKATSTSPVKPAQPVLARLDLEGKWNVTNQVSAGAPICLVFAKDHRILWYKPSTVLPIGVWMYLDDGQVLMKLNGTSPFPQSMRLAPFGRNTLVAKGSDGTVFEMARLGQP